jgi:hypothetical protein|uniref:Uncharacterized protein n=1 Tax=Caudovirales sp. ct7oE3 TaxID=2826768 RepID=A0A8S5LZJ2_9CAUD|nr:MAG TPA: hypothetical protein [Caudovirales sp. ct7oE3]
MSDYKSKTTSKDVESLEKRIKYLTDSLIELEKFSNFEIKMDFSSIGGSIGSLTELDAGIKKIMLGFETFKSGGFDNIFKELATSGSPLAQLYTTINDGILNCIPSLATHTVATTASAGATTVATGATTAFGAALSFLQANPLMAVIGTLGLVVGALTLFGDNESEAEKETRLFNEAQEAKRNELIETSKAINESTTASIQKAKDAEIQSDVLKSFVSNLTGLADENGYVKNLEEAQYYVDQINSAMPGTVKLTEDGKLTWLKNADAIDENIKQLERKAKVEAYYDGYVESLKNETKLRSELTLAQNNYNTELEKQQEYQAKFNELMAKSREGVLSSQEAENLTYYREQIEASNEKLGQYSETLDKAKGAYEANAKGAELYNQAVGALDGSIESSAQLQLEEYTALDENGKVTWDSLAAASEDCKNRITTAQGDELEVVKMTSGLLQEEMLKKAYEQGASYDEMVAKLKESGAIMNEEEEKQLKKSYGLWQLNSKDIQTAQAVGLDALKLSKMTALSQMNDNDKEKLSENVKLFAEKGDASGIELCNKLAASLETNNGEITDETKAIMAQIEQRAKAADPRTQIEVDGPSKAELDNINKTTEKGIKDQNIGVGLKPTQKGFSILGHTFSLDWLPFAEGGFPETGQLFVAREAGPELVGRINGKTAVANNDQIVTGISSGVYNAVRSAMQGNGGNGNMNIHATFVMDGEVVGKQVIKYHNGVVKRTGTTPLMI